MSNEKIEGGDNSLKGRVGVQNYLGEAMLINNMQSPLLRGRAQPLTAFDKALVGPLTSLSLKFIENIVVLGNMYCQVPISGKISIALLASVGVLLVVVRLELSIAQERPLVACWEKVAGYYGLVQRSELGVDAVVFLASRGGGERCARIRVGAGVGVGMGPRPESGDVGWVVVFVVVVVVVVFVVVVVVLFMVMFVVVVVTVTFCHWMRWRSKRIPSLSCGLWQFSVSCKYYNSQPIKIGLRTRLCVSYQKNHS